MNKTCAYQFNIKYQIQIQIHGNINYNLKFNFKNHYFIYILVERMEYKYAQLS